MNTIHIEGFADELNLAEALSNNYQLDFDFPFGTEEEGESIIGNVFLRFYESDAKCSLDDAIKGHLEKVFGALAATGHTYGYSEVTIEGFDIKTLQLGGHNLQKIIDSKGNKYLHILIDVVK